MSKVLVFIYGVIAYLIFFASFLYLIGFLANYLVPKGIDDGLDGNVFAAIITNLVLLSIFALQHSIMARPGFKAWWTKFVPASIERSTYVLFSSLVLFALYYYWQPMTNYIWYVENETARMVIWAVYGLGVLIVLLSTFMIGHFELFGLTQVLRNYLNKGEVEASFRSPGFYKLVRHPIMTGFIIASWATPEMSQGHFLFALVSTIYIVVALRLEERDLVDSLGEVYRKYQKDVPQLFPFFQPRNSKDK